MINNNERQWDRSWAVLPQNQREKRGQDRAGEGAAVSPCNKTQTIPISYVCLLFPLLFYTRRSMACCFRHKHKQKSKMHAKKIGTTTAETDLWVVRLSIVDRITRRRVCKRASICCKSFPGWFQYADQMLAELGNVRCVADCDTTWVFVLKLFELSRWLLLFCLKKKSGAFWIIL